MSSDPYRRLRAYAVQPGQTRGRRHDEPEHPYRDCFERDRDRIIHSRAFRRLEYKTQVFPNYEGDHFRTRLTHTIEVAQLARTVARVLGLNETLAEAIALSHDIGHPPFGHVGEEALDELTRQDGGFEHNRHTLRTVDELEEKYAAFPGLNLTYEVREGIAKHSTRYDRFRGEEMARFAPHEQSTLEAQIIDLVDSVAYNVHDIDDGVEAHILSAAELAADVPLFGRVHHRVRIDLEGAGERALFNETIRRMVDRLVTDLIDTTAAAIADAGVETLEDVRGHEAELAAHSPRVAEELIEVQAYLKTHLYRGPRVTAEMERAREVLRSLFQTYLQEPGLLPSRHRERCAEVGTRTAVADYVAGMTDRYVMREHERLVRSGGQPVRSG